METWIDSLPAAGAGVVVVGGFLALTIAFGYLVGLLAPREVRAQHNELAGFILAVIGVVYAVLLAFVTIGVWERYQQAEERTFDETGMLAVVYRDADVFTQGPHLRAAIRQYVEATIDDEWPKMRRGEGSEKADALMERVDRIVRTLPVTSDSQQDVHDQILQAVNTAQNDRDARLSEDAGGIHGLMWVVLIAGAVLTVGFTFLFGFRNDGMQYVMTGALALLIGLVLYLTVAMNYPYRGSISVQPEAFRALLLEFDGIGRATGRVEHRGTRSRNVRPAPARSALRNARQNASARGDALRGSVS
ncbi:MAG TPA: DUF4239 domain-containing protein [Candidatus Tumulicola sp.]